MNDEIQISLTKEEAWILFEFVKRFSDTDKLSFEDQAEQRALWTLCATFEKTMHLGSNLEYDEFIARCKERLRDDS